MDIYNLRIYLPFQSQAIVSGSYENAVRTKGSGDEVVLKNRKIFATYLSHHKTTKTFIFTDSELCLLILAQGSLR